MQTLKNEAFQFDQWDLLKKHYKHQSVFKEDLEGPLLKSLRFFSNPLSRQAGLHFFSDFLKTLCMDNVVFGAGQHHFTATKP